MKKLLTLILSVLSIASFAQTSSVTSVSKTTLSNLDTLVTATTTTTAVTTAIKKDTLKYKPPVPVYTVSGPITCQSNTTYKYLTIDLSKSPYSKGFNVSGKTNVHITHCRIINSKSFAVWVGNGSSNIIADSNFVSNIGAGFYAENSSAIKFNANQVLNVNGNGTLWTFGHDFQFVNISGYGNQVNYNRGEDIAGVAVNPHDRISIYNCFPKDTIQVIGNWFRGGQLKLDATGNGGACGITIADVSGNLQVVRNNILVNTGYAGIQCIGSGTGVKIDHNLVYSANTPISLLGFSIQDKNLIYCGYNRCNWMNSKGVTALNSSGVPQYWLSTSPKPLDWATNKWADPTIAANILPAVIITMK